MAFADNLCPHDNPMLALHASPVGDTVLARPHDWAEATLDIPNTHSDN
jgi:hypothetical protein